VLRCAYDRSLMIVYYELTSTNSSILQDFCKRTRIIRANIPHMKDEMSYSYAFSQYENAGVEHPVIDETKSFVAVRFNADIPVLIRTFGCDFQIPYLY
jgi:hypothetical protein